MLATIPEAHVPRSAAITDAIGASVAYLASDAALRSIELDPYWPKWDSPWWHMLVLHELGETQRIPRQITEAMTAGLDRMLHFFPIQADEAPGADLHRDVACHCALGTMVPLLAACGIDVERALPWVAPWFARYQLADGGLNCDEKAYLVAGESPSSMVATVPAFELLLSHPGPALDRAAHFLIERALVHGSSTVHNAAERDAAPSWQELAFPRFYFYDILRGLTALSRWRGPIPRAAIEPAVTAMCTRFPDGVVRIGRQAIAGRGTLIPTADHSPSPRGTPTTFPLLDAVSVVGAPSEALTREWNQTRARLLAADLV
ncbi:MAG: hypothetical protein ABI678_24390 [Kofleriaceae bacterium]